jgi:superfamily II DNA/RNA helicase
LNLKNVRYQILDEGDKMLDMGFEQDILEIQNHLQKEDVDNMIFSATVPAFI